MKAKKKQKSIAERKTESAANREVPYKALGLGLLLWLFVTWLFFGSGIVRQPGIALGQSVPSPINAAVDFECIDLKATASNRTDAEKDVLSVFTIDPDPAQIAAEVGKLFEQMQALTTASSNEYQQIENSMNDWLRKSSIGGKELVSAFPSNQIASAKTTLTTQITQIMSAGILSDESRLKYNLDDPEGQLTIANPGGISIQTVSQKQIHSIRDAIQAIAAQIPAGPQREVVERLLGTLVKENLTYDEDKTKFLRKQAIENVEPTTNKYLKGTALVNGGESADKHILLLLKTHDQKRREEQEFFEQFREILGNGILLLAGLIATSVILRIVAPKIIRQPSQILLLVILSLFTLGMARLLMYLSAQYSLVSPALLTYLIPHALAVLLAAILLGGSAAICLGLWTSFATAVLFNQSFDVFALGLLITITATSTARNVHRRASLFRAGLWVCAVKVLFVLVNDIINPIAGSEVLGQVGAAVLSGMLATVVALLLIPLFEKLFKITTDITLLELSDMGHPLLQKMAIQAPGTYHHSLMVATLSQNAAEAIGANPLLVRVCAYYHDIGKMAKPEFFTENIQHAENPHDELSPHMSALVISSHVKEGLTLAKRHKLPQPIMDAIEQHHGNGLISYFYHKAKTQQGDDKGTINDSDFRYGGAPASSPEMSILSLADAAEAASRSIEKPTQKKISNMMDDIFATKIRDGQLDYANLTMAQINIIKKTFVFSLSNMLHGRIPYPKDHEDNSGKPTKKPSNPSESAPKAD